MNICCLLDYGNWLGLLDVRVKFKPQFRSSKRNYKKYFFKDFFFSRFLAKTLKINKIAMKSFSKISRSKSTFNYRSRHSCIKLTNIA